MELKLSGGEREYANRVEQIEKRIIEYRESAYIGELMVSDVEYDNIIEYLSILKPDSPLLHGPVKVIEVKEISNKQLREMERLVEGLEEIPFSLSVKGINVELTYERGMLVRAETYGRAYGGRDITYKVMKALGMENSYLENYERVKLKGKVVISTRDLPIVQENIDVKTAYEAVFKIIMGEMVETLELYDIIHFMAEDIELEGMGSMCLVEKMEYLESLGYIIPEVQEEYKEVNIIKTMGDIMYTYETEYSGYPYETEGVRMYIPSGDVVLIKKGKWGRPVYVSTVEKIEWDMEYGVYTARVVLENEEEIKIRDISIMIMMEVKEGNMVNYIRVGDIGSVLVTDKRELVMCI